MLVEKFLSLSFINLLCIADRLRIRLAAPLLFFVFAVERVVSQVQVARTELQDEHDDTDDQHRHEGDEREHDENHFD